MSGIEKKMISNDLTWPASSRQTALISLNEAYAPITACFKAQYAYSTARPSILTAHIASPTWRDGVASKQLPLDVLLTQLQEVNAYIKRRQAAVAA